MRLWSIHPKYLDRQGLVALWREGLLAQKVLAGKTRGYKYHPQLLRFKETTDPLANIGFYLNQIILEASSRGYRFDHSKIIKTAKKPKKVKVTQGQVKYEFHHLLKKLKLRSPKVFEKTAKLKRVCVNPAFRVVPGIVQDWEKVDI